MEREKHDIEISDLIYKSLTGNLRGNEADILEAWLQNPDNQRFYMELKNTDRLFEGLREMCDTDTAPAWEELSRRVAAIRRRRRLRWLSGVAACLLAGVAAAMSLWPERKSAPAELARLEVIRTDAPVTLRKSTGDVLYLDDTVKTLILPKERSRTTAPDSAAETGREERNVLATSAGSTIEVTLYDGTRVWLNASSELEYPAAFTGTVREVTLRGEGYFEVAKDARRPFVVRTPSARVEVLGTSFNVLAPSAGKCVTTLVEGRVRLADSLRNELTLSPGQQAELSPSGTWRVRDVDTRYYTAWRDGLFAFKDCTLREIVSTLADWYRVTFLFSDDGLSRLTYTTMLRRYDQVDDVLRILEKVGDFRCERVSDDMYLIKRK